MVPSSEKPFGEALRALMSERDLTYRSLAEMTRQLDGKGMTHAHINMLANGHDKPSMRALELIAQACGVQPEYFAEYRLAAAVRELDPEEVGLARALENLNARLGERRTGARGRARQRPQADAQGNGPKQSLIPAGRRYRAQGEGEQRRPRHPRHLHAPARDLWIASDHLVEASGKEAQLMLLTEEPR